MNDGMWLHPQTQAHAARLKEFGYLLVGPADGALAHDEGSGPGRLEEPDVIIEHIGRVLGSDPAWHGRRVVVTAGPTREPVDAVRVISNRSSGRMGFALAAGAWRRGADVLLIAGPTSVPPPHGPRLQRVETAVDMEAAVRTALADADILVMAAAVADFRPVKPPAGKIKKSAAPDAITLEPTPDVLRSTRDARAPGAVIVGFALESDAGLEHARAKLQDKALDFIVLNSATEADAGFDVDTNRVVIIDADAGEQVLPLMSKDDVADAILDRVASRLAARP
jgi:phosphopantothenoylcysteine decarboxylase / phosphopantothenate---cysteine ligase